MESGEFPSIQRASRITREYLERIQNNLQRGHGFNALPFAGLGQSDDKGEQFGIDDFEYLDVELTGELSGNDGAYGWKAIVWTGEGNYEIWKYDVGGEPVFQGGEDVELGYVQPAYEANRTHSIEAGKTARIYRAHRAMGVDDANAPGQEWVFWFGGGIGGSNSKVCRVAHAPVSDGNIRYYPSRFAELDASGNVWSWGSGDYDCVVVQAHDHPARPYDLDVPTETKGGSIVTATADGESKTLMIDEEEVTLPVYVTTEYPSLTVKCWPGNWHPNLP